MDVRTFDNLLHDAEVKLKRLRALYEQYFQGIERIEPSVARKDLDRLFHTMHKSKPRNTAARFRLQQLQASYNTYQAYWQRIVRQIEEGTYERDVRRARRRGGASRAPTEAKTFEIDVDVDDIETDEILAALGALATPDVAPPAPPEPKPATRAPLTAFSPFASKLGTGKLPAAPAASPAAKKDTLVDEPPAARPTPPASGSLLDLDRKPSAARPAPPPSPRAPSPARPAAPQTTAPQTTAPQTTAPQTTAPQTTAPQTTARQTTAARPTAPQTTATHQLTPRQPASPRPSPSRPGPLPSSARVPSPSLAATSASRPALPKPTPRTPQPTAARPPERMRGLYDEYVAARRRNNEPIDNLRYEKMAASVQKMEAQLKQRHAGKSIDFEVVVRDGRVGLKPKIG